MIKITGEIGRGVNRFNLTFSGEIIAGYDPADVKLRFGELFAIDDPLRLDRFFSGDTVILRRNLERKDAAQYYHELHLLGAVAALVKVTTSEAADAVANAVPGSRKAKPATGKANSKKNAAPARRFGSSDRTWAVRSASASRNPNTQKPSQRDPVDIAAGIKARKLSSQRRAAEQAAQERAALAEQQRLAREEEARQATLAAERQRIAEAEAARKAEEKQRQIAEDKRLADEAAAQRAALEAENRRKAAEEAARKAAEEAALKQREAAEAARIKAAKVAAKRKAALEEAQRKALRQREKAERARKKAEDSARRKAEEEAQKRQQAEEDARQKAQQAELKRREAEEEARLQAEIAAIKRREEAEAAQLQAELQAKAREAALQAERIRQEAQRQQLEAERKSAERKRAAAQALATTTAPREEPALGHKPEGLSTAVPAQPLAPVTTALEVPGRTTKAKPRATATAKTPSPLPTTPLARKRQSGEPNLYKLRPFRANEEVRTRSARAQQQRRRGYTVGMIALAALLLGLGSFLQRPVEPAIDGPRALAVSPRSGPLLLAGDSLLLHDRAGISTETITLQQLQLSALAAPLVYTREDVLLARGTLAVSSGEEVTSSPLQILRCEAPLATCREFSAELHKHTIDTFVVNPVDDSVLLVDAQAGLLLKADRDGKLLASADITLPANPTMRLHGGLLLINSESAPALSVLRYEDNAFAKQLDEILLLPPSASDAELLRVSNFLWSGDAWWVSLENSESGAVKLYRFDEDWNFLNEVPLPFSTGPLQLSAWGSRTLVGSSQHIPIERFNAAGAVEARFVSGTLESLHVAQQQRLGVVRTAWGSGLLLCALIAFLGLSLGYFQNLRALVYNTRRESGAEPVDDYANALRWIDPVTNRATLLRRRIISYGLLVLGVLLMAVALSVTVWQLAALLLALSGPLIALLLLSRQPIGHIAVLDERLLLVDHSGMYHFAGDSRIQHCGPLLCIDDVVVFSGTPLLPAFSPVQIQKQVRPVALGGIKVDRITALVKLIQSRHPLAIGGFAILGTTVTALLLLCLQGLY